MRVSIGVRREDAAVVAAFQPIFDLRDGCVVGYEALARPRDGSSPEELFAAGAPRGRLARSTATCRAAALRDAAAAGLGAPFALFLNADAGALELDLPDLPPRQRDADHGDHRERADRAPGGGPAHADAPAHARLGRVARRRRAATRARWRRCRCSIPT